MSQTEGLDFSKGIWIKQIKRITGDWGRFPMYSAMQEFVNIDVPPVIWQAAQRTDLMYRVNKQILCSAEISHLHFGTAEISLMVMRRGQFTSSMIELE